MSVDKLTLIIGADLVIPETPVKIHQPTINEIALIGEERFFYSLNGFTINIGRIKRTIEEKTEDEKKARLLTLNQVVNEYYLKGNKRFENQVVEVLVEGVSKNNKNMMCGYSAHNKLVNFKGSNELVGKIVKIKVTRAYSWHLFGELCEENN